MIKVIFLIDVKVGQKFYLVNKNGCAKYNGNMTMEMTRNSGNGIVKFTRLENGKPYNELTDKKRAVII
jgi:hypothetical protein